VKKKSATNQFHLNKINNVVSNGIQRHINHDDLFINIQIFKF